jgi:hypothetical protein
VGADARAGGDGGGGAVRRAASPWLSPPSASPPRRRRGGGRVAWGWGLARCGGRKERVRVGEVRLDL